MLNLYFLVFASTNYFSFTHRLTPPYLMVFKYLIVEEVIFLYILFGKQDVYAIIHFIYNFICLDYYFNVTIVNFLSLYILFNFKLFNFVLLRLDFIIHFMLPLIAYFFTARYELADCHFSMFTVASLVSLWLTLNQFFTYHLLHWLHSLLMIN